MHISNRGLAELAGHEGIVLSPYRDSKGIWTIGVGHTSAAGPPDPAGAAPITLIEAMDLFRCDVGRYEQDVAKAVHVELAQTEFDALVSFHYNTGAIGKASAVTFLNRGDRDQCAQRLLWWDKPPEVAARRQAEVALFSRGVYSHGGTAPIYDANDRGRVDWGSRRTVDVLGILAAGGDTPARPDPGAPPGAPTGPIVAGLARGAAGTAVEDLQRALVRLGYDPRGVDGKYGPGTAAAVEAFQRGRMTPSYGTVDAATAAALTAALAG